RPDRQLAIQLDRQCVHRDRADGAAWLASDPDLGSGQVPAEAVRVAHRDDSDPGRALGHEPAAVAGALARSELPNLRKLARPVERRLEAVLARIGAERREAVEGDPAAGGVETSVGETKSTSAVRQVPGQVSVWLSRFAKVPDLGLGELGIRVRGREM